MEMVETTIPARVRFAIEFFSSEDMVAFTLAATKSTHHTRWSWSAVEPGGLVLRLSCDLMALRGIRALARAHGGKAVSL